MTENKNVFTGSVCVEKAVVVPDGWRLVPITPTSEMIAALKPVPAGSTSSISSRYTELVLAAPTLTSSEPVTTKKCRIGNTVFGEGCKISTVLERAYREYDYKPSKPITFAKLAGE